MTMSKSEQQNAQLRACLATLDPLPSNKWIVAIGPGTTHFYGSSYGYTAANLPVQLATLLNSGNIQQVTCMTFGENPFSWFIAYNSTDGKPRYTYGAAIHPNLREWIDSLTPVGPDESFPDLRVQLGPNNSYLGWTGRSVVVHNVPLALKEVIKKFSKRITKDGRRKWKEHCIDYAVWNSAKSYYVELSYKSTQNTFRSWSYTTAKVNTGWRMLWHFHDPSYEDSCLSELACVALHPYHEYGDSFVFIKRQRFGHEADFVLHFRPGQTYSRFSTITQPYTITHPNIQKTLRSVTHENDKNVDERVFRWARATHNGRPHKGDTWELELKQGEQIKVFKRLSEYWYWVGRAHHVEHGYAPAAWLKFGERCQRDPRQAYAAWKEFCVEFKNGTITEFPDVSKYMDVCMKEKCLKDKKDEDGIHICMHDLEWLLSGGPQYTEAFLKAERNQFHPDRVDRLGYSQDRKDIKKKAEILFVMTGILISNRFPNG